MLLLDNAKEIYLGNERVTQIWTGVPNKNLLRPDLQIHTGYLNSYNSWTTTGFHVFIPIEVQGTYYFTQNQGTSNGIQIAVANANKYVISGSRSSNTSSSVDVKQLSIDTTEYPTAKYVVVCWYYDDFEWQMVLLNDSSTTYIPFEIQKKQLFDWKPYTELNWIETSESTGGWEIDFKPTTSTCMTLETAQLWAENDYNQKTGPKGILFSAGVNYAAFYYCGNYGSYVSTAGFSVGAGGLGNSGWIQASSAGRVIMSKGSMYSIKLQKNKVYIGSDNTTLSRQSTQPDRNLVLGGEKNGITSTSYTFGPQHFRSCIIYDTDGVTELIHLIAVLRKSDNVPCLYDTINKRYYTTSGTTPTNYEVKS